MLLAHNGSLLMPPLLTNHLPKNIYHNDSIASLCPNPRAIISPKKPYYS